MAFDQSTRNRLARFVGDVRNLLTEEFTRQLQNEYGLDPESGTVTGLEKLTAQDDTKRETARILRETMDYYLGGRADDKKNRQDVLQRIVREQAFTVLNRLCALRMAESRGILIESIAKGYQSKGFQLYARLAGNGLGETGDAYISYLFSLFDEFAVDLAVLFDRFNPQGRLFPRQTALVKLLDLINDLEIEQLWAEDETIGWMYQYFNTKEERKEMRDASQAPRNSRELAVRNQFFTPRYVVEFLTDNTLGRIWYEMTKGETSLKDSCLYLVRRPAEIFLKEGEVGPAQEDDENLSQVELLKQPVYIPHRPLKDPREIKMLDPACGSMHFGLYAFDLFEQIYAEAWDLEETQGDAHMRLGDLESLHTTYQTREGYLHDAPRLIIEHNIHGVDIDPRAVQIAGLSLWLRAQKSWHTQSVKPQDRPQIRRSNIVCAEPMPGDRILLEEFLQTFKEDRLEALMRRVLQVPAGQMVRATKAMAEALANLVRTVWQEMELAGEAGSLLQIEVTLRAAIEKASTASKEKAPLFSVLEFGTDNLSQHASTGTDSNFWNWAETLVLEALQEYAEQSENDGSFRRRLFTDDATQGFAFIDLCQKHYDVVLMNPPFGEPLDTTREYIKKEYSSSGINLFSAFILRAQSIATFTGAITDSTWLKKSDYGDLRRHLVDSSSLPETLVDLGWNVLDSANVATCCFVISVNRNNLNMTIFRLTDIDTNKKENYLKKILYNLEPTKSDIERQKSIYWRSWNFFGKFPEFALAYETPDELIKPFESWKSLEPTYAEGRRGYTPGDSFRFFRCWWEVPIAERGVRWWNLNNGSPFAPIVGQGFFAAYNDEINNWEIYKSNLGFRLESRDWIGKAGLGYGKRTDFMYAYPFPASSMFSNEGHCIFPKDRFYWSALGYLNSILCQSLINLYCGQHKTAGYVSKVPCPDLDSTKMRKVGEISKKLWLECRGALNREETDENFLTFIYPHERLSDIKNKIFQLNERYRSKLDEIDKEILSLVTNDSDVIARLSNELSLDRPEPSLSSSSHLANRVLGNLPIHSDLIHYIIGVLFGRWDIRYATGTTSTPELPDPFAPLSACQPGMLQNAHKLPATPQDIPVNYPLPITWGGILVDDEVHSEDIEGRLRLALHTIRGDQAETIEAESLQILGMSSLREYFKKTSLFFADHLKRYSKGRRQAPIYWPLSTPSNSYTLWLYYHRLNGQTLFTCVNDFVDPKIKQVSEEAKNLRQKKSRTSSEEKELERLTDFEHELKDFRDELLRVAKFWKPNLNDGVQITSAPLWKLFQHKPWQKKLRETWESLEAGEYDWAHLAFSIWPERVREKCKSDKSLAIAHDLEHLYVEPKAPLKKTRKIKQVKAPSFLTEEDE